MKNIPLVSVIIPVYNCELYLSRCLRSILSQSLEHCEYEVIVIDDCSTDRTNFVASLFKDDITIILLKENKGLPAALNVGIQGAKGKYIIRLDADDFVNKDYLKILSMFLELNNDYDAVACDYLLVDEKESVIRRCNAEIDPIGCGVMFRIEQLIEIGLYDESFFLNEDIDLRKRFTTKHKIVRVPIPLYRYRRHENNITNNIEKKKLYDNQFIDKYKE